MYRYAHIYNTYNKVHINSMHTYTHILSIPKHLLCSRYTAMGFSHLILFKTHDNPTKWKLHYLPYVVSEETGSEKLDFFLKVSQPFFRHEVESWATVCPAPKCRTCNHFSASHRMNDVASEETEDGQTSPTGPSLTGLPPMPAEHDLLPPGATAMVPSEGCVPASDTSVKRWGEPPLRTTRNSILEEQRQVGQ